MVQNMIGFRILRSAAAEPGRRALPDRPGPSNQARRGCGPEGRRRRAMRRGPPGRPRSSVPRWSGIPGRRPGRGGCRDARRRRRPEAPARDPTRTRPAEGCQPHERRAAPKGPSGPSSRRGRGYLRGDADGRGGRCGGNRTAFGRRTGEQPPGTSSTRLDDEPATGFCQAGAAASPKEGRTPASHEQNPGNTLFKFGFLWFDSLRRSIKMRSTPWHSPLCPGRTERGLPRPLRPSVS